MKKIKNSRIWNWKLKKTTMESLKAKMVHKKMMMKMINTQMLKSHKSKRILI